MHKDVEENTKISYKIKHTFIYQFCYKAIPVIARFKALVCGRSLGATVGSNSVGDMDVCFL